jgi:hypothetical protein
MRALGTPDKALHESALTGRILPAGISALSREQPSCQRLSKGEDLLWGLQYTSGHADGLEVRGGKMAQGLGKNCVAWGPGGRVSRTPSALRWEAPRMAIPRGGPGGLYRGWGSPAPG